MENRPTAKRKTAEEIALAYRSEPWWYDVRGFLILTFAYNSTLPEQFRHFGRNMKTRHLELACGSGTLLELILRWRSWKRLPPVEFIGVDYADSMLAGAMRRFAGVREASFELADAASLPFPDASFSTVNIANALHSMPDVDAALKEVVRVLVPGGTMAANVLLFPRGWWPFKQLAQSINAWGMRKGILHTPYELGDIRQQLIRAGLKIDSESVSGNCYNVIAHRES